MNKQNRRNFIKASGLAALSAGVIAIPKSAGAKPMATTMKLGLASYTLRKFDLDQTIAMTKQVGLKHIAFKSMHMPLKASADEIKAVRDKVKAAGLNLYGAGVIYMKKEEDVNQAFEYAKAAGIKTIIGVPNHDLLNLVNEKVKTYDINVAIHNHGPGDKVYPSPQSIIEKIEGLDARIGLCMDIGHTTRIGLDPSVEAKKYKDRLIDVHIKDVTTTTGEGKTVEIGRGIIDIPKFLKTLTKIKYDGIVSFEYEKDGDNPMPGLAESVGYVNGVLRML